MATDGGTGERGAEPSAVPPGALVDVLPVEAREGVRAAGPVRWLVLVLLLASLLVAGQFLGTLVFASWFATVFWNLRERLVARTRRRGVVAFLLTVALIVSILGPIGFFGTIVGIAVSDLVASGLAALTAGNVSGLFGKLLGGGDGHAWNLRDLFHDALREIPVVIASVGTVFQALADFVVHAFLFTIALYYFFLEGRTATAWIEHASPLPRHQTRYLMRIWAETGRGMLVGVFLVIVAHGVLAAAGYAIIGVPRALELGVLTAIAGLVPAIGTGLVWIPLALILAATGHVGKGIAVFALGLVIGAEDNLLRPVLAKLGAVPLPILGLFVGMFGGIAAFGAAGLLLGPLLFALARAATELYIQSKERTAREQGAPPPDRTPAAG